MSVRKEVFYGNAKALLGKPAKRVWFRLNPLLEKTSLFVSRRQDNSQFTLPLQSVVICEKFLSDESALQSTCTEADFWDYLWSENWKGLSLVRVFEGQLFDTLLEAFYGLEESKVVTSYQTGVFTENIRFTKKSLKGCPDLTEIKETLNIRFTYYGRRTARDRTLSSAACSSETMSVPGFEDTPLSDDEYREYDLENDQQADDHHSEKTPLSETKPETLALSKKKGKRKPKAEAIEEYFSDMSSSQSQPISHLSPYTPYRDSSKPASACTSPGDKSPYQHTMYSLPHFRCSRPTRLNNEEYSLLEKRAEEFPLDEGGPEDNGLWLTNIMDSLSLSGERTVDRLRKRLEQLKAERKKNERKTKPKAGRHFLEVVKLVDNYGKKTMRIPRLLRCEKVPTFRQYIVQIIEDKTYDPRFRNKRRVQKFSKRFNLQSLSDFSMDTPDDAQSVKDGPKKPGKNKRNKGNVAKTKIRRGASKSNVVSEQSTHTQPADATPAPAQVTGSSDFVNIVVGITDCTAFRDALIGITEEDEQERLKGDADIQLRLRDNSPGSRHKMKTATPGSNKFSMSTVVTHDTESLEGGLAGSYRSQNRPNSESMVIARGDSILSKYEQYRKKKRKTNLSNRVEEEYEDDFDLEEGNFSPMSGSTATPDLFDSKKLNRKYSFEKLKEAKNNFKKPKFKDILKRFVKIQKVAAVFRKSAMLKSKRRTFVNPLQMSPSPDPSMHFMGKVTYRREAIRPDMEIPDFKHLRAAEFREKLLKALDQFVVRKEQIMSSYKNRSLTSITFTRPEVFSMYED